MQDERSEAPPIGGEGSVFENVWHSWHSWHSGRNRREIRWFFRVPHSATWHCGDECGSDASCHFLVPGFAVCAGVEVLEGLASFAGNFDVFERANSLKVLTVLTVLKSLGVLGTFDKASKPQGRWISIP